MNRCVCCGRVIPEGYQVCYHCLHECELSSKPNKKRSCKTNVITHVLAMTLYYAVWLSAVIILSLMFDSAAPLWLLLLALGAKPE